MNADEWKSLIVKLLLLAITPIATKYHIDGNSVAALCADFADAAVLIYGIVSHWNMKKVPETSTAVELKNVTAPIGTSVSVQSAKVVGALLIGFLLSTRFAHAEVPNASTILQKIHDDAVAASTDAAQNSDTIAKTCYDAIAADAQVKLSTAQLSGAGLLTAFQKVRDVTRLSASPAGTALIVGCAPLVQDAKLNFADFFSKIGAAVLLKGLIPLP